MTNEEARALSTVLDYLAKTLVATKNEILAELRKVPRGPKPTPPSIRLQRAYKRNRDLRKENKRLHELLENEVNKLSK